MKTSMKQALTTVAQLPDEATPAHSRGASWQASEAIGQTDTNS